MQGRICDWVNSLLKVTREKIIVFDVETTGLPNYCENKSTAGHEILQLAMIDGTGKVLINKLFKPVRKKAWPEAQELHGIAPEDVRDKPVIEEYKNEIQKIVDNAGLLVAYNLKFDMLFLRDAGISFSGKHYYDVMLEYGRIKSIRNKRKRYGESAPYMPLRKCAAYFGYEFTDAHDAEADARATLYCFLKLQDRSLKNV